MSSSSTETTTTETTTTTTETTNNDETTQTETTQQNNASQSIVEQTTEDLNEKYSKTIGSKYYFILYAVAIYVILHYSISIIFSGNQNTQQYITTSFDALIFFSVFGYLIYLITELPENERKYVISGLLLNYGNYISEPMNAIGVAIFILASFVLFKIVAILPFTGMDKPFFITILEFGLVITLLLIGIQYLGVQFFNVSLVSKIRSWINDIGGIVDVDSNKKTSSTTQQDKKEVFHISNNLYTYNDAKSICKGFDAELATYDQIEDAYKNGAEWCEYGWSEDQMAFFPTQKETWEKLQKNPKAKNNCGRTGVNGGYFSNPNIRFGVNCYGVKPKGTETDYANMNSQTHIPQTPEERALQAKSDFWKKYKDQLLKTSSFNPKRWSQWGGNLG